LGRFGHFEPVLRPFFDSSEHSATKIFSLSKNFHNFARAVVAGKLPTLTASLVFFGFAILGQLEKTIPLHKL
jgi:hypothetical protein